MTPPQPKCTTDTNYWLPVAARTKVAIFLAMSATEQMSVADVKNRLSEVGTRLSVPWPGWLSGRYPKAKVSVIRVPGSFLPESLPAAVRKRSVPHFGASRGGFRHTYHLIGHPALSAHYLPGEDRI